MHLRSALLALLFALTLPHLLAAQHLPEAAPPAIGPVQPEKQQPDQGRAAADDGVEYQSSLPHAVGSIDGIVDQRPEADRTENERERTEREIRDLAAQEEVAHWAFPMFGAALVAALAAIASAGASVYGIVLLRGTLAATKDTLEEAQSATAAADRSVEATTKAAYLQSRAYVGVRTATVGRRHKADVATRVEIIILLVNSGRTPAHDVIVAYDFPYNHEGTKHYLSRGPALGADQTFAVTAEHTFIRPTEYTLAGKVTYVDYTGTAQFTNFTYTFHVGRDREGDHLNVSDGPNNAS